METPQDSDGKNKTARSQEQSHHPVSTTTPNDNSNDSKKEIIGVKLQGDDDNGGVKLSKNALKRKRKWEHLQALKLKKKELHKQHSKQKAKLQGRDLEKEKLEQQQRQQEGIGWNKRHAAYLKRFQETSCTYEICIDCSYETLALQQSNTETTPATATETTTTTPPTESATSSWAWEQHNNNTQDNHMVMTSREMASLASQIRYCYAANKRAKYPCRVQVTGLSPTGQIHQHLSKVSGYTSWSQRHFDCTDQDIPQVYDYDRMDEIMEDTTTTTATATAEDESHPKQPNDHDTNHNHQETTTSQEPPTDEIARTSLPPASSTPLSPPVVVPQDEKDNATREEKENIPNTNNTKNKKKKRLVYLTSDSETVLDTLEDDTVYIIGGLVDRNRWKQAALDRATSLGIATARLPLGQGENNYLNIQGTRVLTTNHVFEILLQYRACGNNWEKALETVLPSRKQARREEEDGGDEGDDGDDDDDDDDDNKESKKKTKPNQDDNNIANHDDDPSSKDDDTTDLKNNIYQKEEDREGDDTTTTNKTTKI